VQGEQNFPLNSGGGAACPANSKVGSGSVVVNARPSVPKLITGTMTEFNGVVDRGVPGYRRGSLVLILYIKTSVGFTTTDYFHLFTNRDGSERLVGKLAKPAKPGVQRGTFTIQKIKLSLFRSSHKKPYITNPPTCHGSWPFSLTNANYFGQPSVTAHDAVRCTK
jgi:hypothetical protein